MGIIQWIKKILKKDEVKLLGPGTDEQSKVDNKKKFRDELLHHANHKEIVEKMFIREKQLISIKDRILYQEGLTKENICENIEEQIVLNDVDIHTLMNIYNIIKNQENRGDAHIHYAIKDNNDNYLKLVNRMEQEIKWKSLFYKELKNLSEEDIKRIIEEITIGQTLEDYE